MSSLKEKLLASAKPRTKTVDVDGEVITVKEVSVVDFAEYGKLQKDDRLSAVSYLLSKCVVDDEGNALLTADEAAVVASTARVGMELVNAILSVSGVTGEKKADAD